MTWQPERPTIPWGAADPALTVGEGRGCPVLLCAASPPALGAGLCATTLEGGKKGNKEDGASGGEDI